MKICRNIDLVQIDVDSNNDQATSFELNYYLPKSVDWINRKIHKIVVAEPNRPDYPIKSPFNGRNVYTAYDLLGRTTGENDQGIYFDLYKEGGEQIAHNLSVGELFSQNPHPYIIDEVLDLELSKIHIPGKLRRNGCILLYIFYDEVEVEDLPNRSVTVRFTLQPGQRLSFQDLVNNYVHIQPNRIRGIIDWTETEAPCYLMLRDFNGRTVINNVLSCIFRSPSGEGYGNPYPYGSPGTNKLRNQEYLACADINFDYSYIQEAVGTTSVEKIITFEY